MILYFIEKRNTELEYDLTSGSLSKVMLRFSVPYLIASFLQTFYGMADLFITGQFNNAAEVAAVSVGSQVMHMLTVMIVGLAMGTTVSISHAIGAKNQKRSADVIGNSISIFAIFAATLTALCVLGVSVILKMLQVPQASLAPAGTYLRICFAGIPFITAYNVISSIFRGLGDTKKPMIFVAVAGVVNVGLDYLLIGPMGMGAAGAALATVCSQAFSVIMALVYLRRSGQRENGLALSLSNLRLGKDTAERILSIGIPIACQEGFIQISFLVITMIANSRGVDVAAAVGIVEKVISFLFLVPSAMLSTVSAVAAQNAGAGQHERGRRALRYGITACVMFGLLVFVICQFLSQQIVSLFVNNEPEVVRLGGQYLCTYSLDCILAGIHFCFSGYFSAYGKSIYSFIHNIVSILTLRIPGAYAASVLFPSTLYLMGLAAPMGSLLSAVICLILYRRFVRTLADQPHA